MINASANLFHLSTRNTSYMFLINGSGISEHLHYGKRLPDSKLDFSAMREKRISGKAGEVSLSEKNPNLILSNLQSELTTEGKGDYRTPLVSVSAGKKGIRTLDLRYQGYRMFTGIEKMESPLMQANGGGGTEGIALDFLDESLRIRVTLIYTVFSDTDVITRRTVVKNEGGDDVILRSIYSIQLDFPSHSFTLSTFNGSWGREMRKRDIKVECGAYVSESRRNSASAAHNPAIILSRENGECYLINLIYSGAHRECVEVNEYGKCHVLSGINPDTLSAVLKPGVSFESPEAMIAYSDKGLDGIKKISDAFIMTHIIRGPWRDRLRPIEFSTFEAVGRDFNEKKIGKLITEAADLGFELFTLSDGWFGVREDESSSLGDWKVNTLKLSEGISGISMQCHRRGMMFGLWLEPESVSKLSRLAERHPEWILGARKGEDPSIGGSAYVLDITREDVMDYVASSLTELIQTAQIDAITWNMGRDVSDVTTLSDDINDAGEYFHRYVLSLYRIERRILSACPNLMVTNTGNGGARLDLGMFSLSSMTEATEATDPKERLQAMVGATGIYPAYVLKNKVAASPNRLTLRQYSLNTAFETASFGCVDFSLDLTSISPIEKASIRTMVDFYKGYRQVLQAGDYFTIENSEKRTILVAAAPDREEMVVLYVPHSSELNAEEDVIRLPMADEKLIYTVTLRDERADRKLQYMDSEYYEISGLALKWEGLHINSRYDGNEFIDGMRKQLPEESRIYVIDKKR